MGALLGIAAAVCIGTGDVLARRVVARFHVASLSVVVQSVAMVLSLAIAIALGDGWIHRDAAIGAASGLGIGVGMAAYFQAMTASNAAVTSPVVATLSAVVPYTYTVARGAVPSAVAAGGAALALLGLIVISTPGRGMDLRGDQVRRGLVFGTISGLGYGFGLSVVIEADAAAGMWPTVTQRLVAALMMIPLARVARVRWLPLRDGESPWRSRALRRTVLSGLIGGLSTVLYLAGVQIDAQPTVVGASAFPAASVLGGWWLLGDGVSARQVVGVIVTLAGIALIVA